jgi:hypothetical protein
MKRARAVVAQNQAASFFTFVAYFSVNFDLAPFVTFRNYALAATSLNVAAGVLRFKRFLRCLNNAD